MRKPFDDIFLQDVFSLPVRDGVDPGGALERTMLSRAGGAAGIVRVEEVDIDGTVTQLHTRGGFPVFETERRAVSATPVLLRGFVARAVPGGRAVLFNPYTLAILNPNYSPAKNTYSVQDFATTWNVPAGDTTDWYDVLLFDGSTIKVNAKAMPSLGITANHAFQAIPYCINRNDASDQYGNAERNQTEKRVFAVGRADVKAWGGAGATETLTPTDPRTEDRCLTIGQRVDYATDKAWLGQLYYPATGWDGTGEWYFTGAAVTMLLTVPYLSKVASNANVAMSPPTLVSLGTSSGARGTVVTLPSTPIALKSTDARIVQSNQNLRIIYWYWDSVFSSELQAQEYGNNTRLTYGGSVSSTETQAGVVLEYDCSNTKTWDTRDIGLVMIEQYITIAADGEYAGGYSGLSLGADATTLIWSDTYTPLRGRSNVWVDDALISPPGTNPIRYYEDQTVEASVQVEGGETLVSVLMARNYSYGGAWVASPNLTHYNPYMGQASTYPGHTYGMGIYGRLQLSAVWYPGSDIIPVNDYYKQNPSPPPKQTPDVLAEIDASFDAKAAEYQTQTYYDCENSNGNSRYNFYSVSTTTSSVRLAQAATWTTKDYLLHDTTNGVYISINGAFSGIDTAATLTVTLTVQTRHHTNTVTLAQRNYTYTELLPETEIGTTGKYAVPSPQIRAIFAPLYQEQGSFKGAHYVTQDEEGNGATPFHGFDFLLYLRSYGDIGTLNAENETGAAVYFVPCNLLEMLYAIVFSQEFGVGTTRYPVTYTARFNDLMGTLFADPVRVSIRDGVSSLWTNAFGADFAATSTISLHRA